MIKNVNVAGLSPLGKLVKELGLTDVQKTGGQKAIDTRRVELIVTNLKTPAIRTKLDANTAFASAKTNEGLRSTLRGLYGKPTDIRNNKPSPIGELAKNLDVKVVLKKGMSQEAIDNARADAILKKLSDPAFKTKFDIGLAAMQQPVTNEQIATVTTGQQVEKVVPPVEPPPAVEPPPPVAQTRENAEPQHKMNSGERYMVNVNEVVIKGLKGKLDQLRSEVEDTDFARIEKAVQAKIDELVKANESLRSGKRKMPDHPLTSNAQADAEGQTDRFISTLKPKYKAGSGSASVASIANEL